jgi:peptidyl-dipeptidase A
MDRIDEIEKWLESHSEKAGKASYEKYLGIKDWDMNRFDEERREKLLQPGLLEYSQELAESSADPVERRRGEVLSKLTLRAYIDLDPEVYRRRNRIEEILMKYKPNVNGKNLGRTEVRELMRKEEKRDVRREAYLSDNPLGELLKDEGKQLFLRRNELARKLGYKNYPECILNLLGIPLDRLLSIFKKTKERTEEHYKNFMESAREKLKVEETMPWDIPYILQKTASLPDKHFPRDNLIPSLKKTLKGFGKDFDALNIKIRFIDIPYGGLCFGIKIPDDIRILLNPRDGHRWYSTIFHEFGHAIHGASIRQDSFLLKGSEGPFSEGMADIWGGLPSLPEWLKSFTSISQPEVERFMKSRIYDIVYGIRSMMVWVIFEIWAYKNPDSDLDGEWDRLTREYLLIGSEGKNWASNYFILTYPMYAQNYLLSPMIREQMYASLRRKFGGILGSRDVLDYITENLYADGCLFPWTEKIEKATEKPFGPDDLIRAIESSAYI